MRWKKLRLMQSQVIKRLSLTLNTLSVCAAVLLINAVHYLFEYYHRQRFTCAFCHFNRHKNHYFYSATKCLLGTKDNFCEILIVIKKFNRFCQRRKLQFQTIFCFSWFFSSFSFLNLKLKCIK